MAATLSDPSVDIETQRGYDGRRAVGWRLLAQRFTACVTARKAVVQGELQANFALRQALVDLASCASEMASHLPAPCPERKKRPRRR